MSTCKDTLQVGIRVRPVFGEEPDGVHLVTGDNTIKLFQSNFEFDHVFGPQIKTEAVFKSIAAPIVEDVVRGINGTIFAYGQTASGKTHTMMGDGDKSLGIIPLAVLKLFSIIKNRPDREFIVRVSYMELYNETITDLQDTKKTNLQIRETDGRFIVYGLTETTCSCVNDVLDVLVEAKDNRTIRETKMNSMSSRSHAIFTIIIESKETNDDIVQLSCLHLVDLAGSEKASASISAQGFKEGKYINLSLLTLGTVISKLSSKDDHSNMHVPYRDSKLTRFLQPSLGGNAKTAIVCTVNPLFLEETESTLKFAQRAKKISNKPVINEVFLSDKAKDRKIALLTEENLSLKKQLKDALDENAQTSPATCPTALPTTPVSTAAHYLKDKDIFLNSPLFGSKEKSYVPFRHKRGEGVQNTFIPSHVTLRRKPSLSKSFDNQLSFITNFEEEMQSVATSEASVQTEDVSCVHSLLDESYKCDHLRMFKAARTDLEELQFKYDEVEITSQEHRDTLLDDLKKLTQECKMLEQQLEEVHLQRDEVMKTKEQEKEAYDNDNEQLNEKVKELYMKLESMEADHLTNISVLKVKYEEMLNDKVKESSVELKSLMVQLQEKEDLVISLRQKCNNYSEELVKKEESFLQRYQAKVEEVSKYCIERVRLEEELQQLSLKFSSSIKDIDKVLDDNQTLQRKIKELQSRPVEVVHVQDSSSQYSVDERLGVPYDRLKEARHIIDQVLKSSSISSIKSESKTNINSDSYTEEEDTTTKKNIDECNKEEKKELEERISTLAEEREEMEQKINALTGEREEMEQKINALTGEREEMEQKINALTGEREEMEQKINALTGEREEMEQKINGLVEMREENTKMEKKISTMTGEIQEMEQKINELLGENGNMKNKLEEFETDYFERESKLESLSKELDEQDGLIESLRNEVSVSQQKITDLSEELKNEKAKLTEPKTQTNSPPNLEKYVPRDLYEKVDSRCLKLMTDNKSLKTDCTKLRNEKEAYKKERNIFRAKYEKLKETASLKPTVADPSNQTTTSSSSSSSSSGHSSETLSSYPTPKLAERSVLFHKIRTANTQEELKKEATIQQITKPTIEEQTHLRPQDSRPLISSTYTKSGSSNTDRSKENIHPTWGTTSTKTGTVAAATTWMIPRANKEVETFWDRHEEDEGRSPLRVDWDASMMESQSSLFKFRNLKLN